MSGILFATEAWHPAGERISECLWYFQTRINNIDLPLYCDALEADIRLRIDFDTFVKASQENQRAMVKEVIIKSLEIIKHRCEAKKSRFEFDHLLCDMFPDK